MSLFSEFAGSATAVVASRHGGVFVVQIWFDASGRI
jgi:hypothetical protein